MRNYLQNYFLRLNYLKCSGIFLATIIVCCLLLMSIYNYSDTGFKLLTTGLSVLIFLKSIVIFNSTNGYGLDKKRKTKALISVCVYFSIMFIIAGYLLHSSNLLAPASPSAALNTKMLALGALIGTFFSLIFWLIYASKIHFFGSQYEALSQLTAKYGKEKALLCIETMEGKGVFIPDTEGLSGKEKASAITQAIAAINNA